MHVTTRARRRLAPLAIAGVLALSLAACGGDDDDADATDTTAAAAETTAPAADPTAPSTSAHADHQTVAVDGIDYGYENLPAEVPAGTMLSFTNTSDKEAHELVAFLLPEEETRSVEELVQLPPEELFAMFTGEPAMVLIAGPGEEGMAVVGDGTLTEPGRYIIACAIPIGADPAEIMAPPSSDPAESAPEGSEPSGPPEAEGGPPHFTAGMYGELLVTAA
jgi:plastocyanin